MNAAGKMVADLGKGPIPNGSMARFQPLDLGHDLRQVRKVEASPFHRRVTALREKPLDPVEAFFDAIHAGRK